MITYKSESHIADLIRKENSIAYCVLAEPITFEEIEKKYPAIAAVNQKTPNTNDLFHTKSILVSTVLNKNDDYFDPVETWAAKDTIVDKRCNLEHQEEKIIGHITGNWAIDEAGNLLEDNLPVDSLPSKYHVAVSSVIYTKWENPETEQEIQDLLRRISEGSVFVSMEALFGGFDYLVSQADTVHIVARNEGTSFLSSYLRAYGGPGEYDGYKLGRVLRNIVFCGKGYVSNPANPDSIIFDKNDVSFQKISESNVFPKKVGVYIKCDANGEQEQDMSEEKIKELEAKNQELRAELSRVNVEQYTQEIDSLKQKLTDANAKAEAVEEVRSSLDAELNEMAQERDALKDEVTNLQKELVTLKQTQSRLNRVNILVGGGLTQEEAEAKADQFIELTDETFKQIAEMLIALKKKKDEKMKHETECEEASVEEETAATEIEEETDASETNVDDTVDETEEVRKSIASYFETALEMKESE